MSQTNIEYFNSTLKLFIVDIFNTFPKTKELGETYYKSLLNNENPNDDKYIKRFMRKLGDSLLILVC